MLMVLGFYFSGMVCSVLGVLSMMYAQSAGNYLFTLFDNFAGSVPLLVIALTQCLAVSYIYGLKRYEDNNTMLQNAPLHILTC